MPEEKILTVNLRKNLIKSPNWRRTTDYSKQFKALLKKRLKNDKVKIDQKLNEEIWKRSIQNPPMKIRLKVIKQDDKSVTVELMK